MSEDKELSENEVVMQLIGACEAILLNNEKMQKNMNTQTEHIQQLIHNNNQMAEFAKKQNQANNFLTRRIYVLELFVFFMLCWEVYKTIS